MRMSTRLSRINRKLHSLGNYHDSIPLGTIRSILEQHGFKLLQEDGTEWSGLLCGDQSEAIFDLADMEKGTEYFYIRDLSSEEVVDAVCIPGSLIAMNRYDYFAALASNRELTSRAEYETFHAMGMQITDVYDEATARFKPSKQALRLTWYRMPSGRYEVISYIS